MFSPSPSPKRVAAAAVAALCAACGAHAEEFSWQLSGGASEAEANGFDSRSWSVDATFYVNAIDDGDGPYALASFLNPTTRVSATASSRDLPGDDPTAYTLTGAYVLPGQQWYVGASYAKSEDDDVVGVSVSGPKGYGVRAGRYLGANTTVELSLGRSEQKSSLGCVGPPFCVAGEIELTSDTVGIEVFHVRRFRSLTYALEGSVSESDADVEISSPLLPFLTAGTASDPDVRRTYSVAAELFPTRTLGVRVGYSRPDGDFDVDSYGVAATWFFKPRVAIELSLSETNVDDAPPGFNRFDGTAVRFIGRL